MNNLGDLIKETMNSLKGMVDVSTVVGDAVKTDDGTLVLPVTQISCGFGAGGSDIPSKKEGEKVFGGGCGGGVKVSPVCFLVVKDGNVRMLSVPAPANSTTERIVEMLPDTLDKITAYLDSKKESK